jgi:cytochrome c oxidase subunit 2
MDVDNPFGMDPSDPHGADDVLIDNGELHLPLNEPVKVLLRSKDVLHNFAVPQMRVKMDMVPGMVTYLWFEPTRTGEFEILCEELCGIAHFAMRGRVVVDEADDYQAWVEEQATYEEIASLPAANPVVGQALYGLCAACHGPEGNGNQLLGSPKISGQSAWYMDLQINNFKAGLRGTQEGDIFGPQMAAMMPTLADQSAVRNVISHVQNLPDTPAEVTIEGDAERGGWLYTTCAACHGNDGMGIWQQKGPRLAGMSDWYMVKQLQNFKSGLRGYHPLDFGGDQMTQLSVMLTDDRDILDVVSYINTLVPTE